MVFNCLKFITNVVCRFFLLQKGTGRGPGRPRKVKPPDENNVTIAADVPTVASNSSLSVMGADDSLLSVGSACPSPQSAASISL